jgi:hypothetical protein
MKIKMKITKTDFISHIVVIWFALPLVLFVTLATMAKYPNDVTFRILGIILICISSIVTLAITILKTYLYFVGITYVGDKEKE